KWIGAANGAEADDVGRDPSDAIRGKVTEIRIRKICIEVGIIRRIQVDDANAVTVLTNRGCNGQDAERSLFRALLYKRSARFVRIAELGSGRRNNEADFHGPAPLQTPSTLMSELLFFSFPAWLGTNRLHRAF